MISALEVPSDINLRLFSAFLDRAGISHRISEEGVNQVVWVNRPEERLEVIHFYRLLNSGEMVLEDEAGSRSARFSFVSRLMANVWRFPLTMLLLAINALLFPVGMAVSEGGLDGLVSYLTFLDYQAVGDAIYFSDFTQTMAAGHYWRLLTPMFIHFGWMHIVFNLLWVWEIGRRIELRNGTSVLLLVTLLSSLAANLLQYFMSGPGFFGGMSGVVYGFLGHSLMWDRLVPMKKTGVNTGVYVFMLVFLVLGFIGAIDLLGLGSLANGAHLGGLLAGVLTGGVAGLLQRFDSAAR